MKFYKAKDNSGYIKTNNKLNDKFWVEITEEEFPSPKQPNQQKQAIRSQINSLKQQLASTDYKAIKYAEGWISEEEYAPIKAQRQSIRSQINELEKKL